MNDLEEDERTYLWDGFTDPHMVHDVCIECWPEDVPGMEALCGAILRGVDPEPDAEQCKPCTKVDKCPVCGRNQNKQ